MLDAIASALQLDPTERAYLYTVARQVTQARRRTASKAQSVRPGLLTLIEQLGEMPASAATSALMFLRCCQYAT